MGKDENIYVKLVLDVHFDKKAPNFHMDNDMISWCPTVEEIRFINESIQKISQHHWNPTVATKSFSTPTTTEIDYVKTPSPSTSKSTTTTQATPLPKFMPQPTQTTEKDKSTQHATTTHDSNIDLLLKRKKGEKEQKVAFTP
jgi:hypothetical protein